MMELADGERDGGGDGIRMRMPGGANNCQNVLGPEIV